MSLLSRTVDKKLAHLLITKFIVTSFKQPHKQQQITHITRQSLATTVTTNRLTMSEEAFLPKRALVLRKFSRLEYERRCHQNLSEEQLVDNVSRN